MVQSIVGRWAQDKLERLRKYLAAYSKILAPRVASGRFDGFHYIDAFAGPGIHQLRGTGKQNSDQQFLSDIAGSFASDEGQQRFIKGSPQVALEIEPPFTICVFLEKSDERVAELTKLKHQFPGRDVRIRKTDCNRYLLDRVRDIDWSRHRAVVFLDPFGMQVPWSTIEQLGRTRAIDVMINFPEAMAIQRLLLKSGEFSERSRKKLDDYFGSKEWYNLLYAQQPTLFGESEIEKAAAAGPKLLNWYRSRLGKVFGRVSKAALIRNTKNGPLYYLMVASHNRTGVKIADHILGTGT